MNLNRIKYEQASALESKIMKQISDNINITNSIENSFIIRKRACVRIVNLLTIFMKIANKYQIQEAFDAGRKLANEYGSLD